MDIRHMVKRGDSLWGLAGIYLGSGARYPSIVEYHNQEAARYGQHSRLLPIKDPNLIYVGQTVMVPSREKQMAPGSGKRHEAIQTASGIQLKVEYEVGGDKNTGHYQTITADYTIEATMTGKISIENLTHNNYRYNLELTLSKDTQEIKQKLSEFSDKAFCDLTDGVKMAYESGQVTLQAPIATQANAGPFTFEVKANAPNQFSGSIKTEPLSGIVEKNRRRFRYTAEVEFKVEVTWHPMPRGGPEPVNEVAPQEYPARKRSIDWDQVAKNVGVFAVQLTLLIVGTIYMQARMVSVPGITTSAAPFMHSVDLNDPRYQTQQPGMI